MNTSKNRHKVTRLKRVRPGFSMEKLAIAIGFILAMFLAVIIIVQAEQLSRLKQDVAGSRAQLEQQEARSERIREEIERLYDTEYVELLARKHLGLVKPGEIVFQLND